MDSIFLSKLEYAPRELKVKIENNKTTSTHLTYVGRHAAENLEVSDFVDLTSDEKCFVCEADLTNNKCICIKEAKTNATKIPIAAKLGEVLGNRYLVVVSDHDFICQNCLMILNRLDTVELEAAKLREKVLKYVQETYMGEGKIVHFLPKEFMKY